MPRYPTKWRRTTMRGCGPQCKRMDLLVEARRTGPGAMELRHKAPPGLVPAWIERCN